MNRKKDIARVLAQKGYTLKDSMMILDDVIEVLMKITIEEGSLGIVNFGSFNVVERKQRRAVNPQGESIVIPGHKAVHFRPSKVFKLAAKQGYIGEKDETEGDDE